MREFKVNGYIFWGNNSIVLTFPLFLTGVN